MPANPDIEKEVQDLNTRLSALEHKCARMREAFVKNDLSVEDYDGHRRDHTTRMEQDKVVANYKRTLTGNALWAGLAGAGLLFGQALLDWLKQHIK